MAPLDARRLMADAARLPSASPREIGGKASRLLALIARGFRVPRFVVVTSTAFEEAIGERRPAIQRILDDLTDLDRSAGAAASRHITEAIAACALPRGLVEALEEASASDLGPLLAIRSSAPFEDSAHHSFAGLLDSFLNVRREGIPAALRRVWASAFSERVLAYRLRKGLGLGDITTAVIVQDMVQAEASGVLFTRGPGREDTMLVSAGLGLGEGVVSDTVTCDTYEVGRDGDRIVAELRDKETRFVLDTGTGVGTRAEPVPGERRRAPVLDEPRVLALRDAGLEIERAFGAAQDVEWAFDREGRLFILQSRPVARPAAANEAGNRRIWDNANVVESYPGLTFPLTFSFVRNAYEQCFRNAALGFLRGPGVKHPAAAVFRNLIGLVRGRVYYNLLNWYEMFSYLPAADRHREAWDRMIGIGEPASPPTASVSWMGRAAVLVTALGILLRPRRHARSFFARFGLFYARWRHAAHSLATPQDLAAACRAVEEEAARFWHLTAYNDFCVIRYHDWLAALLRRVGLEDTPGFLGALLSGEPVESVAPARSVVRLAERVARDPSFSTLFESADDQAVWEAVRREERFRSLREALVSHLDAFGDRGLEELKLEVPTFREAPETLVALVRRYWRLGLRTADREEGEGGRRREAEATVRRHAMGPLFRALVRMALVQARFALRTREDMRFARTRLFGIVRGLYRRLGQALATEGLLVRSEDVFFLTTDEALGIVEATGVTRDLAALVAIRKREYALYARQAPRERFETTRIPALETASEAAPAPAPASPGRALRGIGCGPGRATGDARRVSDPRTALVGRDEVLVATSTDPGWVFLMMGATGIVVERGSPLSHTAIIGRELGIPTVVGASGAMTLIPDGALLTLDGSTGEVSWQ